MSNLGIPYGRGPITDYQAQLESEAGRVREKFYEKKWFVTSVKTGAYRAQSGEIVRCNPSSAAFTVTAPNATRAGAGASFMVKNDSSSTNTITIAACAGETIDGASTATISLARQSLYLVSTGTNWIIV